MNENLYIAHKKLPHNALTKIIWQDCLLGVYRILYLG